MTVETMIEYKKENNRLICAVRSDLIASNIRELRQDLISKIDSDDSWGELILDLHDTESIDSIGVNLLVNLYKKTGSAKKTFKTIGCNKSIADVLSLFRLDQHFEVQTA